MRIIAPIALMAVLTGLPILGDLPARAAQDRADAASALQQPLSVVELYTSQGCSSCPQADALLGRLAERPDVLAMSMSVDYWDYLGWRDTLASPKFTERQRAYKSMLGVPMVYTPMMVVNGVSQFVGSDEQKAIQALEKSIKTIAVSRVALQVVEKDGEVMIEAAGNAASTGGSEATLWLVRMAKSVDVKIARGENKGRTITYFNVVRDLAPIGTWTGKPMTVRVDPAALAHLATERCAAFLQQGRGGPIIGATLVAGF